MVGKITLVSTKNWKVDIGSSQDAVLYLAYIDLPSGEHRIRS